MFSLYDFLDALLGIVDGFISCLDSVILFEEFGDLSLWDICLGLIITGLLLSILPVGDDDNFGEEGKHD